MATEEGSRYRLWVKLDLVLGTEEAGTLMRLLSPAGDWSPPVTKDDLRGAIDSLRHELHADFERLGTRLIMWMSTMLVALAALAFAAGRFV
jgi:hypothetical protein